MREDRIFKFMHCVLAPRYVAQITTQRAGQAAAVLCFVTDQLITRRFSFFPNPHCQLGRLERQNSLPALQDGVPRHASGSGRVARGCRNGGWSLGGRRGHGPTPCA